MKDKEFDAVKMMREIRDKLHEKYMTHPEEKEKDLERIRKKYAHLFQVKHAAQ
jgi:hypothetical protein